MKTNQTAKFLKSVAVAAVLLMSGGFAFAVAIDPGKAMQGNFIDSGLLGTYRNPSPGSTGFTIADTKAQMATTAVLGNFKSTAINYSGGDLTSVVSFLGADGGSYVGGSGKLNDAIFELTGFLQVTSPSTIQFTIHHDDATELRIGGQVLISADCCGYDGASATFSSAGYYAVDIIYANTNYQNSVGGAFFQLTSDADNHFYQTMTPVPVPEPETYAMLLAGLGVLGCVTRRRKTL